jgi:hypothetical protein
VFFGYAITPALGLLLSSYFLNLRRGIPRLSGVILSEAAFIGLRSDFKRKRMVHDPQF